MTKRALMSVVAILGILALLFLLIQLLIPTTIGVGRTNVEIAFVVTDTDYRPLSGATLTVRVSDDDFDTNVVRLTTDGNGLARLYRENVWFEDIVRPLRTTRFTFDLLWCTFDVSANGHEPLKDILLHTMRRKYEGYADECHRLRFEVSLRKEK